MDQAVWNDIVSTGIGGAVGGAAAGIVIMLVKGAVAAWKNFRDSRRVYKWLKENSDEQKELFRSTRSIASYNNLTEDRVRFICSHHKDIKLSIGKKEDMWSVYIRNRESGFFSGPNVEM